MHTSITVSMTVSHNDKSSTQLHLFYNCTPPTRQTSHNICTPNGRCVCAPATTSRHATERQKRFPRIESYVAIQVMNTWRQDCDRMSTPDTPRSFENCYCCNHTTVRTPILKTVRSSTFLVFALLCCDKERTLTGAASLWKNMAILLQKRTPERHCDNECVERDQ